MSKKLAFKETIKKGNVLYSPINKIKLYLTDKGEIIINKIRKNKGMTSFSEKDRIFIDKLFKLNFLKFQSKFVDIKSDLDKSGPMTVQWELTRKCNLDCEYCFLKELSVIDEKDPTKVLPKILNIPFIEIILTGGEPLLLGNKLKTIIDELRKNNKGVIVYTNGYLITNSWIDFFKEKDIAIFIGSDFFMKGKNKSLNKGRILELKNRGIDVGINTTITEKNKKEFRSISKFSEKYDIPLRSSLVLCNTDLKNSCNNALELLSGKIPKTENLGCGAGSKSIYVRSDGKITPCVLLSDNSFVKGAQDYKKIKDICSKRFLTLDLDYCKDCEIKFICNSGCRGRSYLEKNNIFAKDDVRCNVEKESILDILKKEGYLLAKESFYKDYKNAVSKEFFDKALLSTLRNWKGFLKRKFILVNHKNKELSGFLLFTLDLNKKIGKVSLLVVGEKYRKKGIGKKLMDDFE